MARKNSISSVWGNIKFDPDEVSSMYNRWAATYDSEFANSGYCAPAVLSSVLSETIDLRQEGLRILDVGIGTGILAAQFKAINPDCHITGIDISTKMLEQCAAKGVADTLLKHDFQNNKLPFADGSFDIVASSGVFELLDRPQNVIAEMGRVLREGGGYSFSTYVDSPYYYNCNFHPPAILDAASKKAALKLNEKVRFVAYEQELSANPIHYDLHTGVKNPTPFLMPE